MGSLQLEPESISNSSLRHSSPLTPRALDEARSSLDGGARSFFMNDGGYDGGGGTMEKQNYDYVQDEKNQGQTISNIDAELSARGGLWYGTHKGKSCSRGCDAPNESHGYVSYEGVDVQRKKTISLIDEDQAKLATRRRSLDIGDGGLQYKRESHSFGYGEEEKRAVGIVHGHGIGRGRERCSIGGERRGYDIEREKRDREIMAQKSDRRARQSVTIDGERRAYDIDDGEKKDRDQTMEKSDDRGRESENSYIRGGREDVYSDQSKGREHRNGYIKGGSQDGICNEARIKRERLGGGKMKEGEREEGGRESYLELTEEGKREGGGKREIEQGIKGVVVVEEGVDYVRRGQWLRAAILGANDGLVSIASLMMGVGAIKDGDAKAMVISGLAGLVGGACSMAIGEFISVYSQRDAERFEKKRKTLEVKALCKGHTPPQPKDIEEGTFSLGKFLSTSTKQEFTHTSPLKNGFAKAVLHSFKQDVHCGTIKQLGANIGKHKEEEEGEEEINSIGPSPWEAAGASGLAFAIGALVPLLSASFIQKETSRISVMVGMCSVALICMGGIGAKLSAGRIIRGSIRVLLGGWTAMLVTYGLLRLFGASGV